MEKMRPVLIIVCFIALIESIECIHCEKAQQDGASNATLNLLLSKLPATGEIQLIALVPYPVKGQIYLPRTILCSQSNETSNKSAANIFDIQVASLGETKIYYITKIVRDLSLTVKTNEDYQWCSKNGSDEFFLRDNTQVLVVKLNQNLTVGSLQKTIGIGQLEVHRFANDATVFHLTFDVSNFTKNETDLQQVQDILEEKLERPLAVGEYVRSASACPPNDTLKIPSTKLPFNSSLATNINKYCLGDFYTGAYWNEAELQQLDPEQLQELLKGPKRVVQAVDTIDIIRDFSETLENVTQLEPEQVKILSTKFSTILTNDEKTLGHGDKKEKSSYELLASLESLLVNTALDSNEVQTVDDNFAVRVENIKETNNIGVLIWDDGNANNIFKELKPMGSNYSQQQILDDAPRFLCFAYFKSVGGNF